MSEITEKIRKKVDEKGEYKLNLPDQDDLMNVYPGLSMRAICQKEGWIFGIGDKRALPVIHKLPDGYEYEKDPDPGCLPEIVQKAIKDQSPQMAEPVALESPDIFKDLKEVPKDSLEAKLYQIIDDIDTGLDMFNPEMKGFENYVVKKIHEKDGLIESDGYKLYYTLKQRDNTSEGLKTRIDDIPEGSEWSKESSREAFVYVSTTLKQKGFTDDEIIDILESLYCAVSNEYGN